MLIGICGYGYTGSGAVLDFLKEFPSCSVSPYDFEFAFPYLPHGIQDLENALVGQSTRFFSSDVAIKEFRRLISFYNAPRGIYRKVTGNRFYQHGENFLKSLVQVEWSGYSWDDYIFASPMRRTVRFRLLGRWIAFYEAHMGKRYRLPKGDRIYLSVDPENFTQKARTFLRNILMDMQYDFNKIVVLNQPFDVNNPARSMKYFDDPYAILVDRDPRDLYILAKKYLKSKGSFIPSDHVQDFIAYHRLIRQRNDTSDAPNILRISFEDMLYHYEETSRKICRFIGLNPVEQFRMRYFDPDNSINNTQLFLKYPDLHEDIEMIERALPEYLYPFEKYSIRPAFNSKPF